LWDTTIQQRRTADNGDGARKQEKHLTGFSGVHSEVAHQFPEPPKSKRRSNNGNPDKQESHGIKGVVWDAGGSPDCLNQPMDYSATVGNRFAESQRTPSLPTLLPVEKTLSLACTALLACFRPVRHRF
jgi:hypothetical protein